MADVTKHDVLVAADAFFDRWDRIQRLDEELPKAESGDAGAMKTVADLYLEDGRPKLAEPWIRRANASAGAARR